MTVIALRRELAPDTIHLDAATKDLLAWSLSQADDPTVHLGDRVGEIEPLLPVLIEQERGVLAPVGPAEVLKCLEAFAERRNLAMPENDFALDLDIEIMGEWPRDLFRRAIRTAWTEWPYRRLPDANALKSYIREELEARTAHLARLETLARKLACRREMEQRTQAMRAASRRNHWPRIG
jgi:hypothetical protein